MSINQSLSLSAIAMGLPPGREIHAFVENRTAHTQHAISNMMLNTVGQEPAWFERNVKESMVRELTRFVAEQKTTVTTQTDYGKIYKLEAVILSREELNALMEWASKQRKGI